MAGLYFPHDFTAAKDSKIISLRMALGWEGYGVFWALIEMLASEASHILPTDYNALAWELRYDAGKLKKLVCDFGLFTLTKDGSGFYSERMSQQLQEVDELREKRRSAANKRWKNANAMQVHTKSDANKIKENKINTSADAEVARVNATATAAAEEGSALEEWRYVEAASPFSLQTIALCDEIATKFNLVDGRCYAQQVENLLRQVHRPGMVDGAEVVRNGLKKLDTAKAVASGKVRITVTRFLRLEIFQRLINGDYDDVFGTNKNKSWSQAGVSFENEVY